ncbi:MAG: ferritin family protein [Phycisphaerae bacterium]|nr:ferritin family protein [Phycisphaerae bacterium]
MFQFDSIQAVLEFAISKEVAAQKLYSHLAETLTDPLVKKLFTDMAAEEVDHRQQLELELMKLGHVVSTNGHSKGPRVSECVLPDEVPLKMGYAEALVLAMQKEKAAFRLYVEMVAAAADLECREVFLTLAEEEVRHMLRFETAYHILMAKET